MASEIVEKARRYLERRRASGVEVAFRIERPALGGIAEAPGGISVVTSPALEPSGVHGMEGSRGARPDGPLARREEPQSRPLKPPDTSSPSIRYTRVTHGVEQSSLFGETTQAEGPDLSGYDLASLDRLVSACRRCGLCEGRTRSVFGSGSHASKIVFIGEAPGREEDLQGLPFVGRAGQLLTKMLAAMGFTRDEVYITNILKCRPPNNRDPQEEEVAACEPYLARQLEILQPVIICALGLIAARSLLKKGTSLSLLRRAVHSYNGIPVAVTYHPAALLRNPNLKRDAWEDLQMVRRLYDERIKEET
jgi:uracil-DNA glycosylase family 4